MDNIYDNKTREETRDKRQFYQDKIGDIVTRQGKTTLKTRKDMTTDNRHDYLTYQNFQHGLKCNTLQLISTEKDYIKGRMKSSDPKLHITQDHLS